eukprot:1136537-Pelagomonas_calceolata.AAC.1
MQAALWMAQSFFPKPRHQTCKAPFGVTLASLLVRVPSLVHAAFWAGMIFSPRALVSALAWHLGGISLPWEALIVAGLVLRNFDAPGPKRSRRAVIRNYQRHWGDTDCSSAVCNAT